MKDLYNVLIMPIGEGGSIQRKDSETQYIIESVYQYKGTGLRLNNSRAPPQSSRKYRGISRKSVLEIVDFRCQLDV